MSKVEDNKDNSGDDRMIVIMVSPTDGQPMVDLVGAIPGVVQGGLGVVLSEGQGSHSLLRNCV